VSLCTRIAEHIYNLKYRLYICAAKWMLAWGLWNSNYVFSRPSKDRLHMLIPNHVPICYIAIITLMFFVDRTEYDEQWRQTLIQRILTLSSFIWRLVAVATLTRVVELIGGKRVFCFFTQLMVVSHGIYWKNCLEWTTRLLGNLTALSLYVQSTVCYKL